THSSPVAPRPRNITADQRVKVCGRTHSSSAQPRRSLDDVTLGHLVRLIRQTPTSQSGASALIEPAVITANTEVVLPTFRTCLPSAKTGVIVRDLGERHDWIHCRRDFDACW